MGKKGKQKTLGLSVPGATSAAPPPSSYPAGPPPAPAVLSPPAAYHVRFPSETIGTIEEQEEFGGLLSGLEEIPEDESWQNIGHSADGWGADVPENSNRDEGNDDSETSIIQVPMPPLPPQPSQKSGRGRDRTASHYLQQQPPSLNPMGFGVHSAAHGHMHKGSIASGGHHSRSQQPQDAWTTERHEWAEVNEWGDEEDTSNGDERWEANDGWNATNNSWGQQAHSATWAHAISQPAQPPPSHATSHAPTGGWQSWGEEAKRLPKVTFDPAIPPSPSSVASKPVLSQLQRSQVLNELLNNPQQNRQPYPQAMPMPPSIGVAPYPQAMPVPPSVGAAKQNPYPQAMPVPPSVGAAQQNPYPQAMARPHGTAQHNTYPQAMPRLPSVGAAQHNPYPQAPVPPSAGAAFLTAADSWQQHQPSQHGNRHQQLQPAHHPYEQDHHDRYESKKSKKSKPQRRDQEAQPHHQQEVHDVWELGGGWNDQQDEEEQQDVTQDAWGRKVHFSPSTLRASMLPSSTPSIAPSAVVENVTVNALPQNKLVISTIPMSKTLSYAYSGSTPSTESEPGRAAMQRITDFQFIESQGEALKSVHQAFYGKRRKASDRFHWMFSPDKDERVSSLLNWINSVSFGIASFGLQKFLQTRERGALIVNAAYQPIHSPSEPAFDWVTWNQIQQTMDRILQESVGYYNPAMQIIVFVLLPSPSGNSVAIWRRKLAIPNNIRLAYQAQITQAMASLRKEYPVLVDEYVQSQGHGLRFDDVPRLPAPLESIPPPPPKKKRKWYKLWLF